MAMPRIVRRSQASWKSVFLDWLLEASENLSLVDWDHLSRRWAVPLGLIINLVYWLCCLQISYSQSTASSSVFQPRGPTRQSTNTRATTARWQTFVWTIQMVFAIGTLTNTWYCFSRKREYILQSAGSENAAGRQAQSKSDPQTPSRNTTGSSGSLGWDVLGRYSPFPDVQRRHKITLAALADQSRKIVAWEPSMASLRLFCVFSPVHAFVSYNYCRSPLTPVLLVLVGAQSLYLTELYIRHVADKRMIYGQVFSEYEKSFVEPRISIMKRDVGVGTRADDNGVYVEVHTPKVGIIDAKTAAPNIPRSASQIKMHDWERPLREQFGGEHAGSPHIWNQQSPSKPSSRRSIASPVKINGSPSKMFKPAGWASGSFENLSQQPSGNKGIKRSKTTSSLATEWD